MFTSAEIPQIIPALIENLDCLPDGAYASTLSLLRDAGFREEDFMPVIMEIHGLLFEAADAENIRIELKSREERGPGPIYEAEFRISHLMPEEEDSFESGYEEAFAPEEEKRGEPLISPVELFDRYLEILFTNDGLWEQFQTYVRELEPDRGEDFFAYRRDLECMDIWRMHAGNGGGGFPLTLFAAAAFLLLAWSSRGHDLEAELRKACEMLNG